MTDNKPPVANSYRFTIHPCCISWRIIICVFVCLANKSRMYYGLLKEPELNIPVEDEDEGGDDDKPKVFMSILI